MPNTLDNKQISNSPDRTTRFIALCSLAFTGLTFLFGNSIVFKLYEYIKTYPIENNTIIEGIIAIFNILLGTFVLIHLKLSTLEKPVGNNLHISDTFKQLLFGWKSLWITWISFYLILAFIYLRLIEDYQITLFGKEKHFNDFFWYISNLITVINGFFFYYLFFVLDRESVSTKEEPERGKKFKNYYIITLVIGLSLFSISTIFELVSDSQSIKFSLVSNLIAAYIAIGMSFFFGRLDSHNLNIPRIILAPLYLYAIIQLFWDRKIIDQQINYDRIVIYSIALVLKFTVFYLFTKWLKEGRFNTYLVETEKNLNKQ
jgi:hypothetical protein